MKSLTPKVLKQIAEICDVTYPIQSVAGWQEVLNLASYSGYAVSDATSRINLQAPITVQITTLGDLRFTLTMLDLNHKHCKTHNHHLQDFETRLKLCGNIPKY